MASEFIALSLLVGIYSSGYLQAHCQKKKKIKRADQILPEVYGTTLMDSVFIDTHFHCISFCPFYFGYCTMKIKSKQ